MLSWIPGHVDIRGNECADECVKRGAHDSTGAEQVNPDLNAIYGISYTSAKRTITRALNTKWTEYWAQKRTTMTDYKLQPQIAPYTTLGTPFEIRFRTACKLGVDSLNATRFRFGRGAVSPFCPACGKQETVEHFITKCKFYKQCRRPLYKTFCEVYPDHKSLFSPISMLCEPIGKRDILRHQPVIEALNTFITAAWNKRRTCNKRYL